MLPPPQVTQQSTPASAGGQQNESWQTLQWSLCAIGLVLALWAAPALAQTIQTRTLDVGTATDTGEDASLATINGNPGIAYYDRAGARIMFARNSAPDGSGTWVRVAVMTHVEFDPYCTLAVVGGRPAIAYAAFSNGSPRVFYVRANEAGGASWSAPVPAGYGSGFVSLAAVNGNPAISVGGTYLRALDPDGTNWNPPVFIASLGSGITFPSSRALAIVNGLPAVCYRDNSGGDLHYVRALDVNGTHWGTPITLDSAGDVGGYCSPVLVGGNPAIGYYDDTNGDLKYVRASDASGTSWGTPVAVDASGRVGRYCSLAVIGGNPAFSYSSDNQQLRYVRAMDTTGAAWSAPVALAQAGHAEHTSLAVVDGSPAIGYRDSTSRALRFVRASDAVGTAWPTPAFADAEVGTGDVGDGSALVIVNGKPAIAYLDWSNYEVKYLRASDAAGTAWSAPFAVGSDVYQRASLAVVHGYPAISCGSSFFRAIDADGAAWSAGVTFGQFGSAGSLAVVNGFPAISYAGSNNAELRYVRASDPDGTAWGGSVILAAGAGYRSGDAHPLRIVAGHPAIGFFDLATNTLKFVRATDAEGTAWNAPLTIDGAGDVGRYAAMEIVNGNPTIAYSDDTNGELKFVRATDAGGTAWGTPVTIDQAGSIGGISLAVVRGYATVAYSEFGTGKLKYVRASDLGGAIWDTPLTVDQVGTRGASCALAEVNGGAAISYYDTVERSLKWATITVAPRIGGAFSRRIMAAGDLIPDYTQEAVTVDTTGVVSVTQDPPSGSPAMEGITTVTLTVTDGAGHTGSTSFTVDVRPARPTSHNLISAGDPAPGRGSSSGLPADARLLSVGDPAIDDAGTVVFLAKWKSPRAGRGSGIFTLTDCLAWTGGAQPEQQTFKALGNPVIHAGRVAFLAKPSGARAGDNAVVVKQMPGGPLEELARSGALADADGALVRSFKQVGGFGSSLGLLVQFAPGTGTPKTTADTDLGLIAGDEALGLQRLLREGQIVGGKKIKSLVSFAAGNGSPGQGRGWVGTANGGPRMHALATFIDKSQALLAMGKDGTVTVLSSTGPDGVGRPTLSGATFASYSFPALNAVGDHAFLGSMTAGMGDVIPATSRGIFLNDPVTGTYDAVARIGQDAPPVLGAQYATLSDPVLAEDDESLAFRATLAGVKGLGRTTLWWRPAGGPLRLLAQGGQQAAETATGQQWQTFTSLAIAPARGPIFTGTLTLRKGGVTPADATGVWGIDFNGTLRLLFRSGEVIDGKVVKSFSVLKALPGIAGSTRSFSGAQQVVWRAAYKDGSSGIVRTTVP